MFKKLIMLSLCFTFLSQTLILNATESTNDINKLLNDWNSEEGVKVELITREEYIQFIAESEGLSYKEAEKIDSESTQKNSIGIQAETSYYYLLYSKTQEYPENSNFSAKLIATIKLGNQGSFRWIEKVQTVGSQSVSGTHNFSWIESSPAWHDPDGGSYPTNETTMGVIGYFEIVSDVSLDIGGSLKGFTVSGGTSSSYRYISEPLQIIGKYNAH